MNKKRNGPYTIDTFIDVLKAYNNNGGLRPTWTDKATDDLIAMHGIEPSKPLKKKRTPKKAAEPVAEESFWSGCSDAAGIREIKKQYHVTDDKIAKSILTEVRAQEKKAKRVSSKKPRKQLSAKLVRCSLTNQDDGW